MKPSAWQLHKKIRAGVVFSKDYLGSYSIILFSCCRQKKVCTLLASCLAAKKPATLLAIFTWILSNASRYPSLNTTNEQPNSNKLEPGKRCLLGSGTATCSWISLCHLGHHSLSRK